MFKPQVEPWAMGEGFYCKVLNILSSWQPFYWSMRVQTMENCCWFAFYNNIDNFDVHFYWNFLENSACKKEKNKLHPHHHIVFIVCFLLLLNINVPQSAHEKMDSYCKNGNINPNKYTLIIINIYITCITRGVMYKYSRRQSVGYGHGDWQDVRKTTKFFPLSLLSPII